jgi:putative protease
MSLVKKPELVLPAGSIEKLRYALAFGADAVYAGLPETSLRANLNYFDLSTLIEAVEYTHSIGKKIYITLNLFTHENDLGNVENCVHSFTEAQPDAFIVSDPGVLRLLKKIKSNVPIHISTQANITNSESVKFWQEAGAKRIILARELHFTEIKKIRAISENIEIEIFIHGAMCMAYSGRCILSNVLTGRDANRGECAQTCRWRYYLVEETRPTQSFQIDQDARGSYILNSKDLCLIDKIPELKDIGIDAYKIEGRTKNIFYVSLTARAYRKAIDDIFDGEKNTVSDEVLDLLELTDSHGYTHGFTFSDGSSKQNVVEKDSKKQKFAGLMEGVDQNSVLIRVKNPISIGDRVTAISPDQLVNLKILDMFENGCKVERASGAQKQHVKARIDIPLDGEGWKFGIITK